LAGHSTPLLQQQERHDLRKYCANLQIGDVLTVTVGTANLRLGRLFGVVVRRSFNSRLVGSLELAREIHHLRFIHTYTHPFNDPLSQTNRVSLYQKDKTNLDFTEARGSEWPWHQLGCMQVCTSLQTDNHASTPPLIFLQAGCPSCCPTNSVKALKAIIYGSTQQKSHLQSEQSTNNPYDAKCTTHLASCLFL